MRVKIAREENHKFIIYEAITTWMPKVPEDRNKKSIGKLYILK